MGNLDLEYGFYHSLERQKLTSLQSKIIFSKIISNPSRSQSQRVTYVHAKEKQQRNNYAAAKSGPRGIRTLDLSDANRTLSQLSYRPIATIRTAPLARNRSDRFYLVRVARIELTAS